MTEKIVDLVRKQEATLREAGKEPVAVILSYAGHQRLKAEVSGDFVSATHEKSNSVWGLPFQIDHEQKEDVRVLWE